MALSKNKATRPTKVVKPKQKTRKTTESFRNHSYKSFNDRIAGLKIDPVRRKRDNEEREELSDDRATYFGRSLARWRDLNLSHVFVSFATKAAPLSDNLPLLLHNQEQIISLLLDHIERGDTLSLEPLLALLSDFAHDLDVRFESHFALAVKTVSAVAAKHQGPAVVEWSFNCLAWLFKYLSRLLAPDLRPVFDLVAPYLGKLPQKPYIVRFAAESMSFLLRKAAANYERNPAPLETIMQHIFDDVEASIDDAQLYEQGIMVLLTDAVKGVQQSLHSTGPAIIRSMLQTARLRGTATATQIVHGVLTSLIHSSTSVTFAPILELILGDCQGRATMLDLAFSAQLLFVTTAVRKGSRISDWTGLLKILSDMMRTGQTATTWDTGTYRYVISALAVAVLYCNDVVKLVHSRILEHIWQDNWREYLYLLCDFVARIDHDRFQKHLADKLQAYAKSVSGTEDDINGLLSLIPTVLGRSARKLQVSELVQSQLVQAVEALKVVSSEDLEHRLAQANLTVQALPHLQLSSSTTDQLQRIMTAIIEPHLQHPQSGDALQFVLGPLFKQWLLYMKPDDYTSEHLRGLCSAADSLANTPSFWVNVLTLGNAMGKISLQSDCLELLWPAMISALSLSDRGLRQNVLDVIQMLYRRTDREVPSVLSTAILIESTPVSLDTSRAISMNIRRLVPEFAAAADDTQLAQAITAYCLGILHVRLSQAWDDAIDTLGHICESSVGEQAMMGTIQDWLFQTPTSVDETTSNPLIDAELPIFKVVSDFECPTRARMEALSAQIFEEENSGRPSALAQFRRDMEPVPSISPDARSQALRVLSKLHNIAEKRSRLIVPTLLHWAGTADDESQNTQADRWNRKDQKSMLHVFSQFQNPRVLYKSAQVYDALLSLCKNGDVEIQKAALKALLAWKTPEIVRYAEHLTALLDETRFREELSVFLQGEEEEGLRQDDLLVVMPVLLRLLYGRLIGGGKEGQQAKRKAVFVALSSFSAVVMEMFVDIALSTTGQIQFTADGVFSEMSGSQLTMPLRQQLGMLNMLGDMIDTLGSALKPFASSILNTIIGCTVIASRKLHSIDETRADESLLRSVRQNGLQALYKLFNSISDDFSSQCQVVTDELLLYRFDKFVAENSQGISATLRIIAAWSSSSSYVNFLVATDDKILPTVADLLVSPNAKDEVRLYLLNSIFEPLLNNATFARMSSSIVGKLADCMAIMLARQLDKPLLDCCVSILQLLASSIDDDEQVTSILTACQTLLVQPSQLVSIKIKLGLLRTMVPLLDKYDAVATIELYNAVCGLFSRLHDVSGRALLSDVFTRLSKGSGARQEVAVVCQQLNQVSRGRLDQPDYEEREQGFVKIYENAHTWGSEQWMPVVHNCLYFIRDPEDTVNRASAAKALRLLVIHSGTNENLLNLVQEDLFGAIQRGMAQKSEFVRAEYLTLLHTVVVQHKEWKEVADMQSLAFDGDDEASFFTNVLHIQQHRRLRALRRLGEIGTVSSRNIVRIFLPLLEQFVFDQAEGDAGRTLSDQTIQTIGQLAKRLRWSDLRKTLLRYYGYLKTKDDLEKTVLRLIGAVVDGLTAALALKTDAMDVDADEDAITSLPQNRVNVILKEYLPPLQLFLHQKDDSKVDRRVAVAISIVKLARLLPEDEFALKLAPTLTDIAHILRSRDLEAREQTRKTLSTILGIVGSSYLHFVLKELRSALQRGYQLHVLSYTVHHLLVTNGPDFAHGDVDECIPQLTSIILDDIFGITGQEKDAEEYKSGMKEVKSSKSYDTMEIVARMASVTCLGQLVIPIQALLQERLDSRMVKKIDELLLRVRRGIDQNPGADTRDMLVFCHELVRQVYARKSQSGIEDWKLKKYIAQSRGPSGSSNKGSTTSYLFKLTAFALALLRKVLRRHEDLQTPANLVGFLPMIGDGLVAGESDVKIEAAKLLSTILRVELPEIDAGIAVYLKEAIAMVKSSHSSINESARAGLELATAVLRERREAELRDHDVAVLLRAIKADIDEPDRQGQTFRFLRTVLGRKIVIPEVYEIMDEVSRIMVNNSDEGVRQNARAAYVQFVVDFPQGKARWDKTTAFLVQNLGFEHASGRKSVLEVIHTLLGRVNPDATQGILLSLFVGLIQRVVSDADASCREMATVLVSRVLEKANTTQEDKIKALVGKWLQSEKDNIKQAAITAWTIILRSGKASKKDIDTLIVALSAALEVFDSEGHTGSKLSIASLEMLLALCEAAPERAFARVNLPLWTKTTQALRSTSTIPQALAIKSLTMLYNDVASTTAKLGSGLTSSQFQTSAGLRLDNQFWTDSCSEHLHCLRSTPAYEQELLNEVSRNLSFFGRLFAANKTQWKHEASEQSDDESADDEGVQRETSALGYLMSRLVYTTRREGISAVTRLTALQTAAAIIQVLDGEVPNLKPLVRTLFVLTDKSASHQSGEQHKLLTDKARETLDLVQTKVGSQKYIDMLTQARKEVNEKRDDRRQKRRIEAVSQPERWAKEKRRRNDAVKARSRAKADMHRSQRRGW